MRASRRIMCLASLGFFRGAKNDPMCDADLKPETTVGSALIDRPAPRVARHADGYLHSHTATEAASPILFVDNQVDDFLRYRIPLVRKLREAGFDVHVALPREPGLEDIRQQGIPTHTFYIRRMSVRLLDELRCWVSLLRLYQKLRPTLVHHLCLKPTLYGGISARLA